MNTNLPLLHEPYPPDIARKYGAVKGMRYKTKLGSDNWTSWGDIVLEESDLDGFYLCCPTGTVAALTTPLPKPECNCGGKYNSTIGHGNSCSSRRQWLRILPHELAALPEKPEGLVWCQAGGSSWQEPICEWPITNMSFFSGHVAYAVPAPLEEKGPITIEQVCGASPGSFAQHVKEHPDPEKDVLLGRFHQASHPAQAEPPPIATGKDFFNEWCGESYKWAYLPAVEREHWNRFAKAILKRYAK